MTRELCLLCNKYFYINEKYKYILNVPKRLINMKTHELINTQKLCFECKESCKTYFIVSHTWNDDDKNYNNNKIALKEYLKIYKYKNLFEIVNYMGCEWLWIDTICIKKIIEDKKHEIPKMGDYYEKSQKCIVYIEDINLFKYNSLFKLDEIKISGYMTTIRILHMNSISSIEIYKRYPFIAKIIETYYKLLCDICNTNWMKRMWTLQEILLSKNITIVDNNLKYINVYKDNVDFFKQIVTVYEELFYIKTDIDIKIFMEIFDGNNFKSAHDIFKMTEKRVASVEQDYIYSLFGILNIKDIEITYNVNKNIIYRKMIINLLKRGDYSVLINTYNKDNINVYKCYYSSIFIGQITGCKKINISLIKNVIKPSLIKMCSLSEQKINITNVVRRLNMKNNDYYKLLVHLGEGDIDKYKIIVRALMGSRHLSEIGVPIILKKEWLHDKDNPIGHNKWNENRYWGRFFGDCCSLIIGDIINLINNYNREITINSINNEENYVFCVWDEVPLNKNIYLFDIGIKTDINFIVTKNKEHSLNKIGMTLHSRLYENEKIDKGIKKYLIKNILPF